MAKNNNFIDSSFNYIDSLLGWLSVAFKQVTSAYCDIETADSDTVLVNHDGSLLTVIKIDGVTTLIGEEEFNRIYTGITTSLRTALSASGHAVQFLFNYDNQRNKETVKDIFSNSMYRAEKIGLDLKDLFNERIDYLSKYIGKEELYLVLWTTPLSLTNEQRKRSMKTKLKNIRERKIPPFLRTQNPIAAISDLRTPHNALVAYLIQSLTELNISAEILDCHKAVFCMRTLADPEFTDKLWSPYLPGDKIPLIDYKRTDMNLADISWPPVYKQIMPRNVENIDYKTVKVGDTIYSSVYISLLPKETQPFANLFQRILTASVPWRISFLIEGDALKTMRMKAMLASILSFSSADNRLLSDSYNYLRYVSINTDEAIVRLKVIVTTYAPSNDVALLRNRVAELAKAIQGWGACDVAEVFGDPMSGYVSSLLGLTLKNVATATVLPLTDAVYLAPITRPASPWKVGSILFRTPDGKPWPFQPGSSEQTTWIDLIFARSGSGKSVLSNTIILGSILQPENIDRAPDNTIRLPYVSIIDIGPSSSGLISLIREALPNDQKHLVAYHKIRMTPEYSINPFDTQLGCRFPTPQARGFLVNFLVLLATPVGADKPYDGVTDMVGLVIDELYKNLNDDENPYIYAPGMEHSVDVIIDEILFMKDKRTSWWEITDALYAAGFVAEAILAQRYAVPLLADAASICRTSVFEDLYGKVVTPTGESLINAFVRMISSAVREYPILSKVTSFSTGDLRIASLDLDEVAGRGGQAADRQTAVVYMLARYVLASNYYLVEDDLKLMPEHYRKYHALRIADLKESRKRIVMDEFHRTSRVQAVRDQVLLDMREGRKWNVQIALISQSLEDFSSAMIEFATSIYIMDSGPSQAIEKIASVFGLSNTAKIALKTKAHGPRADGVTFLAEFFTKHGLNTQLLTLTLGPVELWAFSTTVEDVNIREKLYKKLNPVEARRILSVLFPNGTITKFLESQLNAIKEEKKLIIEEDRLSLIDKLIDAILKEYSINPNFKKLSDFSLK